MHTQSGAEAFGRNLEVQVAELDKLVLDYVKAEDLVEGGTSPSSSNGSRARHACAAVKQLLQQGQVQEAVEVVKEACPAILEDQRLTFRLKKQQFIEQLRLGTTQADKSALACARNELAPLALHAYPEAYLDFKRLLLLLVFQRDSSHTCPVSRDWSDEARNDLACTVFHTMRQHLGLQDPPLSLLLRYLLRIYTAYVNNTTQLEPVPEAQLVDSLLLPGFDAGPLPSEAPAQPFPESVMQSLIQAVGIPRQEALDALKHASGDPIAALKAQLMRLRLSTDTLDGLVREYACHRGLLSQAEEALPSPPTSNSIPGTAEPQAMDVDQQQPPASTTASPSRSSAKRSQDCFSEHQHTSDGAGFSGRADGSMPYGGSYGRADSLSPPYKVPRWRGRQTAACRGTTPKQQSSQWQGSGIADGAIGTLASSSAAVYNHTTISVASNGALPDAVQSPTFHPGKSIGQPLVGHDMSATAATAAVPEVCLGSLHISEPLETAAAQASTKYTAGSSEHTTAAAPAEGGGGKVAPLLQIQALARQGRYGDIVSLVQELQPGLLEEEPLLAFELKRCEFMQRIGAGDYAAALALARGQLTPLAEQHPALQPQLKAAMGALLPGKAQVTTAAADAEVMLATLQRALQARMGLPGPKLMRLLQVLLAAHRAWFKAQRCSDTFADALRIDALRTPASSTIPRSGQPLGQPSAGAGGGGTDDLPGLVAITPTFSDDDDNGEDDDEDGGVDEAAALQLMEILELPRAAALELLAQYDTFEAALHSVLG